MVFFSKLMIYFWISTPIVVYSYVYMFDYVFQEFSFSILHFYYSTLDYVLIVFDLFLL